MDELVTNLGNLPHLESIHLSSLMAPPRHPELDAFSSPSTLLPFIARIDIIGDLVGCLAFLTKLTYPNTATVSINCFPSGYTDNVMPSVRDLITTINAKNIVPITSLYVENRYQAMTFRGQDAQGIERVFVLFQNYSLQPSGISWDSFALHHLKSLRVIGFKILPSVWLSVFGKLKKLKTILIIHHASEFIDVLSCGISRDSAVTSSPGKLNFSALKSLSLSGTLGRHYGERPRAESLASCFRERRRRGLTLRRLCIESHGGSADVVCELSSFIKHVKWTEIPEEETSDEESDNDDYDDEDE